MYCARKSTPASGRLSAAQVPERAPSHAAARKPVRFLSALCRGPGFETPEAGAADLELVQVPAAVEAGSECAQLHRSRVDAGADGRIRFLRNVLHQRVG